MSIFMLKLIFLKVYPHDMSCDVHLVISVSLKLDGGDLLLRFNAASNEKS